MSDSLACSGDHHYEFMFRTAGVLQHVVRMKATHITLSDHDRALTIGLLLGPPGVAIRKETGPLFQRTSEVETPSVIFSLHVTGSFNVVFGLLSHPHQDGQAWERDRPALLKRVCDDLTVQEFQLGAAIE